MSAITTISHPGQQTDEPHHLLTADKKIAFDTFKDRCASEGLLGKIPSSGEDDIMEGIYDDGTLLYVCRRAFGFVPSCRDQSLPEALLDAFYERENSTCKPHFNNIKKLCRGARLIG